VLQFIQIVDRISSWAGKAFSWCILLMTFVIGYEVLVRYAFNDPTSFAYDLSYMMYGTLFMMAGAYTLSRDGHVRADVLSRLWKPKTQARLELVLYILFFFPGILALIFACFDYARASWTYMEVSSASPADVPIFQLKSVIPAAASLLLLQGIAQICRCLICIRTGAWPPHARDVEEMETAALLDAHEDVPLDPAARRADKGTGR
jgi:TRAP-type mannitol/chloroaromatic compound transport system permease small subunit